MDILSLNQLSALGPGADLWICADLANSKWTGELDWHLNHQIRKGLSHQSRQLSTDMTNLLQENQISWANIQAKDENLLVSSSVQLPARWVLVLPWKSQLGEWVQQAFEHWKSLGQPQVRFFLPQNIALAEFSREWRRLSDYFELTVVLD